MIYEIKERIHFNQIADNKFIVEYNNLDFYNLIQKRVIDNLSTGRHKYSFINNDLLTVEISARLITDVFLEKSENILDKEKVIYVEYFLKNSKVTISITKSLTYFDGIVYNILS